MGAINKLRRRVKEAVNLWGDKIANGGCKSHEEYLKDVGTRRAYQLLLTDIDAAIQEEATEGSEYDNH